MNMNILDLDGQIEATFILPPLLTGIPQSQVPEDIKCESLVFGVHQWYQWCQCESKKVLSLVTNIDISLKAICLVPGDISVIVIFSY